MKKFLIPIILVLSACGPWMQVSGLYTSSDQGYSVDLPNNWMMSRRAEHLLITYDGVPLQTITVKRLKIDHEFVNTKKKLRKGMLPQEAAEVILDDISSAKHVTGFDILESSPATIGGVLGFKAVFAYRTDAGMRYRGVYYGALDGEWFYSLRYSAAQRHYFDKDLETFEKIVKSFKITRSA